MPICKTCGSYYVRVEQGCPICSPEGIAPSTPRVAPPVEVKLDQQLYNNIDAIAKEKLIEEANYIKYKEELTKKIDSLKTSNETISKRLTELQQTLENKTKDFNTNKERLSKLQNDFSAGKSKYVSLEDEVSRLQQTIKEKETIVNNLIQEQNTLN